MQTLSIGELAERSGIASQAIRYYEKEKLMPAPQRTEANYRRYPLDAVARLQFIVHAKQWGFTLDEIRELLILQDANGDRAQAKRIAGEKLPRVAATTMKTITTRPHLHCDSRRSWSLFKKCCIIAAMDRRRRRAVRLID